MKRVSLIALSILLLFSMFTQVYAQNWVFVGQSGEWASISLNHVEKYGKNEGWATWKVNVTNFQGLTINVSINYLDCWKELWEWGQWCGLYIYIILNNGTKSYGVTFEIEKWYEFWFASATRVWGGVYLDVDSPKDLYGKYPTVKMIREPAFGIVSIYPDGKVYFFGKSGETHGDYDAIGYNFDHQNVTITMQYYQGGNGKFSLDIQHWFNMYYTKYKEEPTKDWFWSLWNNLMAFFSSAPQWFAWIGASIVFIMQAFAIALPFFPLIVFLWFIDAVVTSITEGNLQPIGNCFMTIYNYLRALIQTIANILSTIWEHIKFW